MYKMDKIGLSREQLKQKATKAKSKDFEGGVSDLSVVPSKKLYDSGKERQL